MGDIFNIKVCLIGSIKGSKYKNEAKVILGIIGYK